MAVQKGTGPDALPEGAATQENQEEAAASPQAGAAQVATGASEASGGQAAGSPGEPSGDEAALGALAGKTPQAPVNFTPQTDDQKFLFESPTKPQPYQPGASLPAAGQVPPPANIGDWLPSLQMAASDPSASPQVKALFQLVSYHLSKQ